MLRRKIYNKILAWKKSKGKECLLIRGARQVGKTYIVREFGKNEYDNFIEINFIKNSDYKEIFNGSLEAEEIYKRISYYVHNVELIPHKTLIFIDEIQKCANARTALKFLAEDGKYDVIASGSLLGLSYGEDDDDEVLEIPSVPVGYENSITMYPMDFEEFLWAYGYNGYPDINIDSLLLDNNKIPDSINEKYESLLTEYLVVGGMPEVVNTFIETKDFVKMANVQEKVLLSYKDDIIQHTKKVEKVKVSSCYNSIPNQLAKENKKFMYSVVEKHTTARKYQNSIQWLIDANMVNVCTNVSDPIIPLIASEKTNEFKLYINDTGLLTLMYGEETRRKLLNGSLKGNAKCGIYENFVAQTLIVNGYKLYYYKPNDYMELEFVIEHSGEVVPIEVKAGNNATISLNKFMMKFGSSVGYKVIDGNIGKNDKKIILPHWMIGVVVRK